MNLFQSVAVRKPKKNKFDLSHESKLTMNMGPIVPILVQETMPGDKFKVNTELLIRLTPLQAPMYQRVNVFTHYFFVPSRIIWDEFKDFITGGKDGTAAPVHPYLDLGEGERGRLNPGSLCDYMGIPTVPVTGTAITQRIKISALPFRAYQLIYNEYYRDETLSTEQPFLKTSGSAMADWVVLTELRNRSWEKDYFTSSLPTAQRGGSVLLPMTGNVTYKPTTDIWPSGAPSGGPGGFTVGGPLSIIPTNTNNPGFLRSDATSNPATQPLRIENIASIQNASTTINDLRTAVRLQEWLEKNMRGGYRYIEQILQHFGVQSSDSRLQRPEYLGGGKSPVIVSEILSTFQDAAGAGDPQGTMAGHGIAVGSGHGFGDRFFEEHGYIIGIMSVIPKTGYQQGVPKMYTRFDKLDYPWPEFAQLGEQAVKMKEIYFDYTGAAPQGENTFGYQSRYADLKYQCNRTHGDFVGNLSYWHQNQIYTTPPGLNENFIKAVPSTRVFAVTDPNQHHLYVQLYHNISAIRPLPYYGTPTL